jgi:hypothetical protein
MKHSFQGKLEDSATRHLLKKIAQFSPNIAQNGALVNKTFAQRNLKAKFGNLKAKSSRNLELI